MNSKYSELGDKELLIRAQSEEDFTFSTTLFQRYRNLLFGLCLKYFRDESRSHDALMEIYEHYIKKIKTQKIANFRPWLYTVAKNHCLQQIRKEKRFTENTDFKFMQSDMVFHPFNEDLKEKQLQKMEECVEKLKDDQKACITMFYLEKQSYQDIASLLSLSWSKVRSLIQNGRRNLKICMELE